MAQLKQFKPTDDREQMKEALDEDGAIIVLDVISKDEIAQLNSDFDPYIDDLIARGFSHRDETTENPIIKSNQIFLTTLTTKSPEVRKLIHNELILDLAGSILLKNCVEFYLSCTTVIQSEPGCTAQDLHRDNSRYGLPYPRIDASCAAFLALTDFTRENGATTVAPGSHRWEDALRCTATMDIKTFEHPEYREPAEDEICQVEMPAGAMCFFHSSLLHGASDNTSASSVRRGLHLAYVLGWLRQEENMGVTHDLEEVCMWPEETQRLMGFEAYGGTNGIGGETMYETTIERLQRIKAGLEMQPACPGSAHAQ